MCGTGRLDLVREEGLVRPLLLAVAACLGLSLEVVHAAGYKRFSSSVCGYSIDYPTSWSVKHSSNEDTFGRQKSASDYAGVVVACTHPSQRPTTHSLTVAEMKAFRAQGYVLSKATYSGGLGIFSGHKAITAAGQSFQALVEVSSAASGAKGFVFAFAADLRSFKADLPIYLHMLKSWRAR
jgi:hypothetical protein